MRIENEAYREKHHRSGKRQPLLGDKVEFINGEQEPFDIICVCTGFWTAFPFFDKSFIDFQHVEKVPLYRKMMHADYPTLYFIGLFQPVGCIWPLADYQAKLACLEILGRYRRPDDLKSAIQYESSIRISISRAASATRWRWTIMVSAGISGANC